MNGWFFGLLVPPPIPIKNSLSPETSPGIINITGCFVSLFVYAHIANVKLFLGIVLFALEIFRYTLLPSKNMLLLILLFVEL